MRPSSRNIPSRGLVTGKRSRTHYNNNKRQAARALGITAKTIYNRLLRYRSQELIGDDMLDDTREENERAV